MGLAPYDHDTTRAQGGGLGTAAFALLLVGGFLLGVTGILLSVWGLVDDRQVRDTLVERGVVAEGAQLELLHDRSTARDLSSGCLVADGALVVWTGPRVDRVPLLGALVERDVEDVVVTGSAAKARCAVGRGAEADAFVAWLTYRSEVAPPVPHRIPYSDPRLERHLGPSRVE